MAAQNKNSQKKIKEELEEIIKAEKHRLELEKSSLEAQIEEINRHIERIPLWEKRLAEIKDELNYLSFLKKQAIANQKEIYSLSREIKDLERTNLKIEKEGKVLAAKIDLLSKSTSACPLCTRKLTNPYRAMLLGEFKKDYLKKKLTYKDNLKKTKFNQKKIKNLKDKIKEVSIIVLGKEELEKEKKLITQELERTRQLNAELPKLREQYEYLKKELSKKSFAPLTRKILDELDNK